MKLRFITGILITLGLMFVVILTTNLKGVLIFIHWPSFVIVVLFSISILIMSFSLKAIKGALTLVFSVPKQQTESAGLREAEVLFTAWQKYIFLAGGIGVLMGLVLMLATISDKAQIGIGLSTSLLSLLYSLVLNLIFVIPCLSVIKKKKATTT